MSTFVRPDIPGIEARLRDLDFMVDLDVFVRNDPRGVMDVVKKSPLGRGQAEVIASVRNAALAKWIEKSPGLVRGLIDYITYLEEKQRS